MANKLKIMFEAKIGDVKKQIEIGIREGVANILRAGNELAIKVADYWKENCEVIVAEFWGDVPTTDKTRAELTQYMREAKCVGNKEVTAFSVLFNSLVQTCKYYDAAQDTLAKRGKTVKNSSEWDSFTRLYGSYMEDARTLARGQAKAVVDHFVKLSFDAEASSDASRQQMDARKTIEVTITDWNALIAGMKGVYKLPAERVLLSKGVQALRKVLTDNPLNIISGSEVAASKPAADHKPEALGETLDPAEYERRKAAEAAEAKAKPRQRGKAKA